MEGVHKIYQKDCWTAVTFVQVHDRVQVLATPDSGLWTAEKDGCVGYMYNSDVQLLGDAAQLGWDHAPAEDNWQGRIRTTSIYTKPHRVKFYCTAVKGNSLKGPTALYFKVTCTALSLT